MTTLRTCSGGVLVSLRTIRVVLSVSPCFGAPVARKNIPLSRRGVNVPSTGNSALMAPLTLAGVRVTR